MKRLFPLLCLSLLLAIPPASDAAIYKWVDANGVVTFRDTPPPEGVKAEVKHVPYVPITSSTESTAPAPASTPATRPAPQAAPAKAVEPRSYPSVEIYSTEWCPACKAAIAYLEKRGVPYTKYDIEKDSEARRRLIEYTGRTSIPYTIIGTEKFLGFTRSGFDAALGIGK